MRIGEVLSRSVNDINSDKTKLHIHNTLTRDEKNTFISDKKINAWLRRINKKYNISNQSLHNHRLRHNRITQWKEAHMDKEAIQYFAGHVEDSEVTDDYIDISEEFAFEEF